MAKVFHSLHRQNLSEQIVEQIGLSILRAKGLIESRPKKGTRVRPRNDWNVLDPEVIGWLYAVGPERSFIDALCEVRLMFEPIAARFAAVRASDDEIKTIEDGRYSSRVRPSPSQRRRASGEPTRVTARLAYPSSSLGRVIGS